MNAVFNVPPTIIIGGGALSDLPTQVKRLGPDRVLLVTDGFMVDSGWAGKVSNSLREAGIQVSQFSGVQPDPTDTIVLSGLAEYHRSGSQAIVALGGGSPIDTAKVIGALVSNPPPVSQYAGLHRYVNAGVPVIAIPTTAGTGSEVTKVAVITDTERDIKMLMIDVNLLPRVAIVDYKLTMTMPPSLTAFVGVDTLIHAIEAYVSRKANAVTDPIALSCIRMVSQNLLTAYREPGNEAAREAMMLASCQGGMAFANSSVCLVHGMSRPLGAVFHIPHGLSNAMLLSAVARYSLSGNLERYATIARVMDCASNAESDKSAAELLIAHLEQMTRDLNIPRLRDMPGIDEERYRQLERKLATDALDSGSPANNPRVPSLDEVVSLYREVW